MYDTRKGDRGTFPCQPYVRITVDKYLDRRQIHQFLVREQVATLCDNHIWSFLYNNGTLSFLPPEV